MDFVFLGTGGAFTDYRVNYHNNALLRFGDKKVLIDCGTTAVQSLKELHISPGEIDAALFTHLHADHASPEQLLWERYYGGPTGPAFQRTRLIAPPDVLTPLLRSLDPYVNAITHPNGEVRGDGVQTLVEQDPHVEGEGFEIDDVVFRFFRVPHVVGENIDKPAYGIELWCATDATLAFWSGDTMFNREWVEGLPETAHIFHECMFASKYPGTVHTHWEDLRQLDSSILRRMIIMHHTEVPESFRAEVKSLGVRAPGRHSSVGLRGAKASWAHRAGNGAV